MDLLYLLKENYKYLLLEVAPRICRIYQVARYHKDEDSEEQA